MLSNDEFTFYEKCLFQFKSRRMSPIEALLEASDPASSGSLEAESATATAGGDDDEQYSPITLENLPAPRRLRRKPSRDCDPPSKRSKTSSQSAACPSLLDRLKSRPEDQLIACEELACCLQRILDRLEVCFAAPRQHGAHLCELAS